MFACGPFTRVAFAYHEGYLVLGTPKMHPEGHAGDLIKTLCGHEIARTWRWR